MDPVMAAEEKKTEFVAKFKEFLHEAYYTEMVKNANKNLPVSVDFALLDKSLPELCELLISEPDKFFEIAEESTKQIDLPAPVKLRFFNLTDLMNIRDLRSKHLKIFTAVEGTVRRASEIRPEVISATWRCTECDDLTMVSAKNGFVGKPFKCNCGGRAFEEESKQLMDTRWITIEEPFELTEGDKPSQLTVLLKDDLVSVAGRRNSDPGNRIRITGVLRDVPKGKSWSSKLDFFMDANHVEPVEIGWQQLDVSEEDIKQIKELAKRKDIYEIFVDSLAPSLYGLREIKEAIILQMFGGIPRTLKDGTHFRGDIHILLIGDPAAGKSQLLKLVPEIVPRGRYVSGKGVTGAGLTATVTKDELIGGWVLEAGALVLANKGLLSIDEFEKMSTEDQVAMHEALEQGTISIAKASIVATLPARTSVLAGGNPKFSRFDPYVPIAKQINIPDTLLSRFDLKFALRDVPNAEVDKNIVDHVLSIRQDENYQAAQPKLEPKFLRKYIAYAREAAIPALTQEAGKMMKNFYIKTRKKATEAGDSAIPITLRQFEAMIRLAEASAKVQLSDRVRKEDAQRAIKLVKFSLKQLGYDPETGEIDVDRSEGLTSSSERGRIKTVLDIINELSQKKKEIPVQEIRDAARKENVEEIDDVLDKLKREGMLFEPTPGFIQKV
jgi:replicative DNA helicase Mcm